MTLCCNCQVLRIRREESSRKWSKSLHFQRQLSSLLQKSRLLVTRTYPYKHCVLRLECHFIQYLLTDFPLQAADRLDVSPSCISMAQILKPCHHKCRPIASMHVFHTMLEFQSRRAEDEVVPGRERRHPKRLVQNKTESEKWRDAVPRISIGSTNR